jgi:hypothetical protein
MIVLKSWLRMGGLLVVMFGPLAGVSAWARFEPVTCKNAFTPEQELSEGQKVAAQVYQQMPVLPDNDPVTRYVQQLGARLVQHAPGERWPYNFHVVASSDINAFALPGGSVFVNLGTVKAAETEAQLAGVMAHEISHVVQRHSTCNITKQQGQKVLYGLGSVLSSVLLGSGTAGALAQTALGLGQSLTFLRMSRDDEKQADLLGTDILYDSGYDPRGMPQFFEVIQAKYGAGGAQFLSDHPNPGNRTEYVDAEIATLPRHANALVTTAEFKRVHPMALAETALSSKEVEAGAWKKSGRYASGPSGVAGVVVSEPVAAGQAGSGQAGGPVGSGSGGRLSQSALGLGGKMVRLQAARFAVDYPATWQKQVDASGTVIVAPAGGAGAAGIVYGALIDLEKQSGDGVTDAASLKAATEALVQRLSGQNAGLAATGEVTPLMVRGHMANSVELRGKSPVVEGGMALAERDWLVTIARADGDVNYIVFVSPERDFALMKPMFAKMIKSFEAQ